MPGFSAERWRVLSPYLDEVLAVSPDEQESWLEALARREPGLAAELRALLAEQRVLAAGRFLVESPVAPPRVSAIAAGQTVGAYTLVSPIGQGGMGVVWLAERSDGRFERRAAVKFLRIALGGAAESQFRREGSILARLSHPYIAQLLDAGITGAGQPYLVIEYVDGEPIDRFCDSRKLDVKARVRLFLDVLGAVAHAHANLIVHRDLKPSNILVDRSGAPKLLDFGIARIVDAARERAWTEDLRLTPEYASPEQIRGLPPATSSDVYSLGAVLYRLVTGRSPHATDDPTGTSLEMIAASEPPAPRRVNPGLSFDLDCIVRMALRREPTERYRSVEAFAEDLRAFLDRRPVQARSGNSWYRTRTFLRRYWLPVGATSLVIGSLATGLFVANRERTMADRRFDQLRQLADQVIRFDGSIRNLPGSTAARQQLVAISLEYLEGLASEASGDVDLMRELAEAYWRVSHVQGVPTETNLGQWAAADASLVKADALIESVLAARPSDRSALLQSAVIAHDRMILAESERRDAQALTLARRAVERSGRLVAQGALQLGEREGLTMIFGNVALALVNMHRYAEAIPDAQRCVEIAQADSRTSEAYSNCVSVLANALRYQGRLDEALQALQEARAITENATYPTAIGRMMGQYGVLLREGLLLGEAGGVNLERPDEAIAALQAAFDMTLAAAADDPDDSTSRGRAGTSGRQLGNVLREGDPGRALAVYDIALERLREIPGENLGARRSEAMTLAESSYALRRLGRAAEARQRIDTAFAILAGTKDYPASTVALDSAASIVLRADADEQGADGHLGQAIAGYGRLLDSGRRLELGAARRSSRCDDAVDALSGARRSRPAGRRRGGGRRRSRPPARALATLADAAPRQRVRPAPARPRRRVGSQRFEERGQLRLLGLGQVHVEAQIVELHHFAQRGGGAVVEVRRARRQATQDRSLPSREVGALARDEGAGRIRREHRARGDLGRACHLKHRQVRHAQLGERRRNPGLRLQTDRVAHADVERHGQRMIADVGRVVARGARAGNRVDTQRVVQAGHASDGERRGVEERLAGRDGRPARSPGRTVAFAGARPILPAREDGEDVRIERRPRGVAAERIVDPRIVGLPRERQRPAVGPQRAQRAGRPVPRLRGKQVELEIDHLRELLRSRRDGRLRMAERRLEGLLRQVGDEVCPERRRAVERRDRVARVEHHGAQEPEVGRGQRSPIYGDHPPAGGRIDLIRAAVRVVHHRDRELRGGRHRQGDPNQPVADHQTVRRRIAARHARTVRAVDVGKEWIVAVAGGEPLVGAPGAQAERIAGQVAGGAASAVGPEALEERIGRVQGAGRVERRHHARRIPGAEEARDPRRRRSGGEGERGDERHGQISH